MSQLVEATKKGVSLGHIGFVYIAGPYSGEDYEAVDKNISNARGWATRLAQKDIPFFCPHLNSAHLDAIVPAVTRDYWLVADKVVLARSSALFLIEDWRESEGAVAEKEYALEAGIPIYTPFTFEDLVEDWKQRLEELTDLADLAKGVANAVRTCGCQGGTKNGKAGRCNCGRAELPVNLVAAEVSRG